MEERLQKIIARAGIASRRHAEDLIRSGMVTVNGKTVTELGSKADEATDHIKVSGKLLRPEHDRVYLVLNKPPEVVSTMSDPEGRRSLQDLLHGVPVRVFPVGRLEYHSMGLVFLTNDGELANRMLKAHRLRQTYLLKLKSLLTFEEIEQLARSTGARITRVRGKESPWYEVTLTEARRDALRNRLFQTGHPVEKIKRIRVGNLELGSLQPGEHRTLSSEEVAALSGAIEGKLEPASEPPIKRTHVKRSVTSAGKPRGGEKRRERNWERRPGSSGERQGRTELTKRSRTKSRKAR
jgi:23S rRNA pseudouridine2605 synthase